MLKQVFQSLFSCGVNQTYALVVRVFLRVMAVFLETTTKILTCLAEQAVEGGLQSTGVSEETPLDLACSLSFRGSILNKKQ
ncbi:hypothetical protein [Coleofasciculus sp.]|uniref:hypothetical protein n=1 Tax=Coleofasciculus sp. TaxID=3100458 RepID=UPI0039FA7635